MTQVQKEFQSKLQIERHVLSVRLQNAKDQEISSPVSTIEIQIHDRMRVRLASIDRAILRLEKGTFGACQSCGEEIDRDRLEALPYAELCIDCQCKLERKIVRPYVYAHTAA